jgi:hypothetical protein
MAILFLSLGGCAGTEFEPAKRTDAPDLYPTSCECDPGRRVDRSDGYDSVISRHGSWGSEIKDCTEQVKCLIASEGWRWMNHFDKLPPVIRKRLSESAYNICPVCLYQEARKRSGKPSVEIYISTIASIEREIVGEVDREAMI